MGDLNLDHIRSFRFGALFNELGWDRPVQQQPFVVDVADARFELYSVAHKRGVQILRCDAGGDNHVPAYPVRQKIERRITREVREHLIIFVDGAKTIQIWQWVNRQPGRPAQYRELVVQGGHAPELLRQKLRALRFLLDEEGDLNVIKVMQRVDDSAPRERVTKKFYREFEQQRKDFAEFIAGIPRVGRDMAEDQRWYTAVLIDRLMFLWFLQEKRFLDGKQHYLSERFDAHVQAGRANSFYRSFLCPLFFRGFAEPRTDANRATLRAEFGNVPYLNGGLFAQHQLEQKYGKVLEVEDVAFEKLFAFFGDWEWHLDERPMRGGREINPDVLGYIFEKFVNQKQMGAYYTKEDITGYIGQNTIIPCLLQKVRTEHPAAFDALAWPLLKQSGDAYIYPAMLKGIDAPYPEKIAAGLDTDAPSLLERRKAWNRRAAEGLSLPTESWRETIARHQHTRELRRRIAAGELHEIGELITCNLDIRQFAQDLIEGCTVPALLRSFWFNLAGRLPRRSHEKFRHGLSVLDPTCGSGAFLFAALNVLKPLYEATLRTLQAARIDAQIAGYQSRPERWEDIDDILHRFSGDDERVQDYAITKHIIVQNLYGVDIEEQATEIAKLRLFLKLVALLEPGDEIEPLPDIDFNIRHGNTLVGYATAEETERAVRGQAQGVTGNLFGDDPWHKIKLELVKVELAYDNFQIQQVQRGGLVTAEDKRALTASLVDLEEILNRYLAGDYGVDPDKARKYADWKKSHQPFHWLVDFHPLMATGGFDVVIGNPPYIAASRVRRCYDVRNYTTSSASDIYAWVLERNATLLNGHGATGMIVPLSLAFSRDFATLRTLLQQTYPRNWYSSFARIPAALFSADVRVRNVVHVGWRFGAHADPKTTRLHRWFEEFRPHLMESLTYATFHPAAWNGRIPKLGSQPLVDGFERLLTSGASIKHAMDRHPNAHMLAFKKSAYNWLSFGREDAPCFDASGAPIAQTECGSGCFRTTDLADAALLTLNGKIQFAHWVAVGDDFHVTQWMFDELPVDLAAIALGFGCRLRATADGLWRAMQANVSYKQNAGKRVGNFNLSGLRDMTDDIDVEMLGILGESDLWQEIELLYGQTVRTTSNDEADE